MIDSLRAYNQWIVWRLENKPGVIKPSKIPYNPRTGERASSVDSNTWADYNTAVAALRSGAYSGIGFVISPNDPYFFLDLDGCRDTETGELTEFARGIVSWFPGAAWEISQSGEGLHIIGRCDVAQLGNRRNKWAGWLEFYTRDRFIAFGPSGWQGSADIDWTPQLAALVPVRADGTNDDIAPSSRDAAWRGPEDDDELIAKILANIGGTKAKLGQSPTNRQLWDADAATLGQFFPSSTGQPFDHSQADQALMNVLAFWTGKDHARMCRVFSRSKLGQREKWTKRAYYRNRTAFNSIRTCRDVYVERTRDERRQLQIEKNAAIGDEFNTFQLHAPILTVTEMYDRLFYVHGVDGIVDSVTFETYRVTSAERVFVGSVTDVPVGEPDPITNEQKLQRVSNFKLWMTEADGRPKKIVAKLTWKPRGGQVCYVPESLDRGFNMWRGFVPHNVPANWQEWLQAWNYHLAYLIPVEAERQRFEQWMAHIVQCPESLPHTGYLMFTEQTGIGRNWLSSVLVRVLRGYVAAGIDVGKVLDGGFNGRLSQKLLAVVDEVRAGMDQHKYQRAEKLKSVINEESRLIDTKHGLQTVEHNCMRWLFFSNHPDALPFDNNDRRIVVIANPTERLAPEYYSWLYGMLNYPEFIASVFQHLSTLSLDGFNAGEHAPMNMAKRVAIMSMTSEADKAALDFATRWPGRIATVSQLREHIGQFIGEENAKKLHNIGYVVKRAGMVAPDKVIKINGRSERILIVRDLHIDELGRLDPKMIAAEALGAAGQFAFATA